MWPPIESIEPVQEEDEGLDDWTRTRVVDPLLPNVEVEEIPNEKEEPKDRLLPLRLPSVPALDLSRPNEWNPATVRLDV